MQKSAGRSDTNIASQLKNGFTLSRFTYFPMSSGSLTLFLGKNGWSRLSKCFKFSIVHIQMSNISLTDPSLFLMLPFFLPFSLSGSFCLKVQIKSPQLSFRGCVLRVFYCLWHQDSQCSVFSWLHNKQVLFFFFLNCVFRIQLLCVRFLPQGMWIKQQW